MLLLRGLSKADFAAWGLFLVLTYFLEMGRSGLLQNGFITFWATAPADRSSMASTSACMNLSFSVLSTLLLAGGLNWLSAMYEAPQLKAVLPVYFLTNFVMAALYHFNFVAQANHEFRGIFWSTFFFRGVLFAWILLCWCLNLPFLLPQMAWAMCAGAGIGCLFSMVYARPFLPAWQWPTWHWARQLTAYGRYVLGTNLSTMFYKNIDKLTLGSLIGPSAFAVYDAAGKITQMVEAPSFSIAAAVFPQSAQRMATEGVAGVRSLYENSVAAILALILPFVAFALVAAKPMVLIFAGAGYEDSANILRITAFFGLFMPFAVQFGTILDSTGRPAVNFIYTLFTALLNGLLCYLFVRQFGLFGAAYATLLGYFISFVLMQQRLNKDFGIRWWRAFVLVPEMYRRAWALVAEKVLRRV